MEMFDSEKNEFIMYGNDTVLTLEHSLVSVAKWESKWKEPWLSNKSMTVPQTIDYVRCMTITQNVDPSVYKRLTNPIIQDIMTYINDPMTAATFSKEPKGHNSREKVTAETIYYWMIKLGIPMECQKWHLNRLIALIKFVSIKDTPAKKMSMNEIYSQNRSLNQMRKKAMHTRG